MLTKQRERETQKKKKRKEKTEAPHLHARPPPLHGAGPKLHPRVPSVRAFFLFDRLREVRAHYFLLLLFCFVVLRPGRRLLYFFDTNLKPTVSRDAEEKRDRFFLFNLFALRRKGRRRGRRRRRGPLFCARQRRKRSIVRPRRRGVQARAPREERERERVESEFLLLVRVQFKMTTTTKIKKTCAKKKKNVLIFLKSGAHQRETKRERSFFFSTIYESIACSRNRADDVSVSTFSITNYPARSLCARWRRRRCW